MFDSTSGVGDISLPRYFGRSEASLSPDVKRSFPPEARAKRSLSFRHQSNMFLFIKRTLEFGYKEATFQQVEGLLRGSIKAALTLLGRPLL